MTTVRVEFQQLEPGVLVGGDEADHADPKESLKLQQLELESGLVKPIIQVDVAEISGVEKPLDVPKTIVIGSLLDDRLRMTADVSVDLEVEGGDYIANFEGIQEFGYGLSALEAVDDLRKTLSELYWSLNEEGELGSDLQIVREKLNDLIQQL